MEQCKTIKVCC